MFLFAGLTRSRMHGREHKTLFGVSVHRRPRSSRIHQLHQPRLQHLAQQEMQWQMTARRTASAALLAFAAGAGGHSTVNVLTPDRAPAVAGAAGAAGAAVTPKTRYSDQMRLVFTVGLEGAGHHYVVRAFEHVYDKHHDRVRLNGCRLAAPYFFAYNMAESPSHFSEARAQARNDMRKLALEAQPVAPPGIVATMQARRKHEKTCDLLMASFPTFGGPQKVFQFMDFAMLAEMAEAEGIDLRLVYLQRSAKELIIADTRHRHFQDGLGDKRTTTHDQRYMEYIRILFTEISVMHSMFAELGPGFVVCHRFDRIGTVEQASKIANFISPDRTTADLFTKVFTQTATSPRSDRDNQFSEEESGVAARLQRKLDVMERSLCKG